MLPEAKSFQLSVQWGRREGAQGSVETGHGEQDLSKPRLGNVTGSKEAKGVCKYL